MAVALTDPPIMIAVASDGVGVLNDGVAEGIDEHSEFADKITLAIPPIGAKGQRCQVFVRAQFPNWKFDE